ncbi:hypothetical protein LTR85_002192 [Meristemomyces frigidus]|nr:hypothetical protein LTR85_002192 [Meristemomyces frigidus]
MAPNHSDQYYLDLDAPTERLISTLKAVAAYGCPAHNANQLCSCDIALAPLTDRDKQLLIKIHFTLEWQQHLLATDAAILFNNQQDHAVFAHLTGTSPTECARLFAHGTFAAPAMVAPASTTENVIEAMLAHWADRAADWRSRYSTEGTARAALRAYQRGEERAQLYHNLGVADSRYPPQVGKRLVLQRVRMGPPASPNHRSTIYLLPLKPLDGDDARYMVVGVKPCHEDCSS